MHFKAARSAFNKWTATRSKLPSPNNQKDPLNLNGKTRMLNPGGRFIQGIPGLPDLLTFLPEWNPGSKALAVMSSRVEELAEWKG